MSYFPSNTLSSAILNGEIASCAQSVAAAFHEPCASSSLASVLKHCAMASSNPQE